MDAGTTESTNVTCSLFLSPHLPAGLNTPREGMRFIQLWMLYCLYMLINHSAKTSWFHLGILIIITAAGIFAIKQAFEKPFVQWQTYNEVRAAEIKAISE